MFWVLGFFGFGGMYKNQLQELAQRSCFNLPSYACIREGPDHAPRFRASVNFHGEIFQGPSYCTTLRQAEHAAAEVALSNLSTRGTSKSLAARVLDETGVYKNLLQETAHRAGLKLPVYTTVRSGPGHQPIFTSSVELAGMSFNGEPAKTKKQAEKNAAMAAWSALKEMPNLDSLQSKDVISGEEHEQVMVAGFLSNFKPKDENRLTRQRRIASPHSAMGFRHQWRFNDPLLALPSSNGPKISPLLPLLSKELPSPYKDMNNNFSTLFPSTRRMNEMPDAKGKSIDKNHFTSMPIHESTPRPSYQRAFPHPYQGTQQTQTPFRPSLVHPPRKNSIAGPIPTTMGSGGFNGIAPAVLMRSVIPVCAAPPPSNPSQRKSEIRKKEAQEEVLAINLQLNKFQL